MSRLEDRAYYEARLETERQLAASSDDPAIANLHAQLAEAYARRLRDDVRLDPDAPSEQRASLKVVRRSGTSIPTA